MKNEKLGFADNTEDTIQPTYSSVLLVYVSHVTDRNLQLFQVEEVRKGGKECWEVIIEDRI